MPSEYKCVMRKKTSFTLSADDVKILKAKAKKLGFTMTTTLAMMIRAFKP